VAAQGFAMIAFRAWCIRPNEDGDYSNRMILHS
jgi:hypothetical protein